MRYAFAVSLVLLFNFANSKAGELADLHQRFTPSDKVQTAPGGKLNMPPLTVPGTIRRIGIERTRCLAGCPAYTLIIRQDGSFRYVGEYGVERLGSYTGMVSRGRLNQLLAFIEASDFNELQASYLADFLDGPTVYTLVETEDVTKVVENYAGSGPPLLWAIEQLIDDLLETAEWNPGGNEF